MRVKAALDRRISSSLLIQKKDLPTGTVNSVLKQAKLKEVKHV